MSHPGPKTLLQRIVKKALSSAGFGARCNSPERRAPNTPKAVTYEGHDTTPRGKRTPYHSSYWHIVTRSQHNADSGSFDARSGHDAPGEPPQSHPDYPCTLSIQTHRNSIDTPPGDVFSLDKFIQENESWAPPSPREVLSHRQFREARQASNVKPQTAVTPSSGDYFIRRQMKS